VSNSSKSERVSAKGLQFNGQTMTILTKLQPKWPCVTQWLV